MRQALVRPGEGKMWVAEVPSLPGCVSQGSTKEEAISNIREAIALHIEVLQSHNQAIPADGFEALLVAV